MPLDIEVKLTQIGNSVRVTVPKDVLRALQWKAGDVVHVGVDDSTMTVKKSPIQKPVRAQH